MVGRSGSNKFSSYQDSRTYGEEVEDSSSENTILSQNVLRKDQLSLSDISAQGVVF